MSAPETTDDILKQQIQDEIKKEDAQDTSLQTAEALLTIHSVDKEYAALKKRIRETHFVFQSPVPEQTLRPYQTDALMELSRLLAEDEPVIAVQLPTGSGKTFLIHSFIQKNFAEQNVLIITPSWEIAHQHAMTVCQQFANGADRICRLGGQGQIMSLFQEYRPGMRGQTIITTSALFFARQVSLRTSLKAGLVVIDEGHHGWKKKRLNSVQEFARALKVPAVLLTATPPRNMENLPFAAQLKYLDLVPEFLVKCHVIRLETGQEFDPVLKNGLLVQRSRVELSERRKRFEKIVADSVPHVKGQTIYYAGSVREAMGVVREFAKHDLRAVVVHSKWSAKGDKINALAIDQFRQGKAQVLVNVQMLAMGFDVPRVETIIVARPVESDILFTQMVGRGARPSEEKEKFILIDVHDTIFKPEVAKIFEHSEAFYAGAQESEPTKKRPGALVALPAVQVARHLMIYPYRPRATVALKVLPSGSRAYFTLQGRNAVVNHLLDPHGFIRLDWI